MLDAIDRLFGCISTCFLLAVCVALVTTCTSCQDKAPKPKPAESKPATETKKKDGWSFNWSWGKKKEDKKEEKAEEKKPEPAAAPVATKPDPPKEAPAPQPKKPRGPMFPLMEIFVIGGAYFWLLSIFLFISLCYFLESDRWVASWASIMMFFGALYAFGNYNVVEVLLAKPWHVVGYISGYLVIAVIYAFFRWGVYLTDEKGEYDDKRRAFLDENKITGNEMPDDLKHQWKQHLRVEDFADVIPKARRNKNKIIAWMSLWPWSFFWFMIRDFVRKIFTRIYYKVAAYMQRMADKRFSNAQDDF